MWTKYQEIEYEKLSGFDIEQVKFVLTEKKKIQKK